MQKAQSVHFQIIINALASKKIFTKLPNYMPICLLVLYTKKALTNLPNYMPISLSKLLYD